MLWRDLIRMICGASCLITERNRRACLLAAALAVAATGPTFAQTAPSNSAPPSADAAQTANEAKPAAGAALQTPPGMVRYDHPVLRNGKLILWHGAWRGRANASGLRQAAKTQAPVARDQAKSAAVAAPPKPGGGGFALLADPSDACANRLAGDVVAALQAAGTQGKVVAGGVSAAALGAAIDGDSADLAIAPIDALVATARRAPTGASARPISRELGAEPSRSSRRGRSSTSVNSRDAKLVSASPTARPRPPPRRCSRGSAWRPSPAVRPPRSPRSPIWRAGKIAAVVGGRREVVEDFGRLRQGRTLPRRRDPWSPSLRRSTRRRD